MKLLSQTLGAVLIFLVTPALGQKPIPELPRVYIDTTWTQPQGGTTWRAHSAAELSTALAKSAPGDVILLDAGTTYVGNFVLPAKENPRKEWIYIESSTLAKLPAGKRVGPEAAVNMPKIVTLNTGAAFQINEGANHWRLAGLELTSASTKGCNPAHTPPINCFSYFLVGSPAHPTPLPDSFVIDRCYIHGAPDIDLQSGVMMNASNYAVVDSHIGDVHMQGFDSVALGSYWSPGPFKVVNDYLSSSTENLMFGGAGGPKTPYVPSDIEIRNNYLFKPLSWVPLSLKHSLVVKNAFELKSAQRVLFDGNVIENVWSGAIVLTVRSSQSGDIAVVNDLTITNNVLKNVVSGFSTLAADDLCGVPYTNCHNAGSQARWYIANNLITFYDPTLPGGQRNIMIAFQPGLDRINGKQGVIHEVVFQHNTGVSAASAPCWSSVYFGTALMKPPFINLTQNVWILDNVLCRQPVGGSGLQSTQGMTQSTGASVGPSPAVKERFFGNVMYVPPDDKVANFPSHNLSTTKPIRYVDATNGNYDLLQPKWTETSDGKLAGIDFATLHK